MSDNWQLKAVLSANAEGMLKTLKAVNNATKNTRKYLADVGSSSVGLAKSLAMPVGAFAGLAAAFSIGGMTTAVKNFAVLGDEVAKGSQRIGVSIAEYQQLSYVAGQSGVSVEGLGSSMGRLNKGIAEAAAGKNQNLAGLLKKAGISMRDANGHLRSGAQLLPEVADLFERNTNAATQARMGNAIFGKSWQELAPLLQGGSSGIQQLQERYKQLGIEVDAGAIKSGEAFGDQMDDLNQVMRSYGNTITGKLLPVLGPLMEKTIQWAVANRDLITTRVTAFVSEMATAMSKIDWAAVVNGVGSFFNGLKSLVEWLGGSRNALIALVLFMNINTIAAFVALTSAVFKLGMELFALAFKSLPATIAKMGGLEAAMGKTAFGAGKLLGVLGQIGLVAGAGWAGWKVGGLLNDYVINPATRMITGDKEGTLGTALYDAFNKDPMAEFNAAGTKPSLVRGANQVKASGQISVMFENAPVGTRFLQDVGKSDIPINASMGYSSRATGMP